MCAMDKARVGGYPCQSGKLLGLGGLSGVGVPAALTCARQDPLTRLSPADTLQITPSTEMLRCEYRDC
jgi:hypothetical protein